MKIILASHGSIADAMLKVLHMIMGNEDDVESCCLDTYEDPYALSEAVKKKIEAAGSIPVVLVCDIINGSIFNHLLPFCDNPGVVLFTGMNLNLILSLVNIKPKTETEFEEVLRDAKADIRFFNMEILDKMKNESDEDSF
jgi:mannose/fructose-specific phosphotransferase system component IIA